MRSPLAFAAIVAAVFLAGCNPDGMREVNGRHMQPLSGKMLAEIESKNMEKESPILVRIFKQESEFEVWKEDKTGRFALLRTYPICRWSGELGPKIKTGDRQAPEGFYTITPGQMNPNSSYYLAFNIGFPNAYDRANGYTGAFLMVHGDCLSAGCYAMTDEQIAEIYALARESFLGGQKSFQIQAYPFRMTPLNLAKHRNSPHMAFWKMLKQGYDHFEVTRLEPKVNVCEKRYVFGAETSGKFNAAERCPAYKVPGDIATAVQNKQRRDDVKIAELVNRGTPAVPVKTGVDGGMNPTFLTAMKLNGGPGVTIRTAAGTIPNHVSPPAEASTAKHVQLCFDRIEAGFRTAVVGTGGVRGAFWLGRDRWFLQQSVWIEGRREPSCFGGSAEVKGGPRQGYGGGSREQAEDRAAAAGGNEDCKCCSNQAASCAAVEAGGRCRSAAKQADRRHRLAQRRVANCALRRLQRSLRRLALSRALPCHCRSKAWPCHRPLWCEQRKVAERVGPRRGICG